LISTTAQRSIAGVMFFCTLLLFSGCAKRAAHSEPSDEARFFDMSAYAGKLPDTNRFIAVSHKLQLVAAEPQLQKSWESVINFCTTIHCEILNSSIISRTRESLPSASISLRVAPEDVPKLMEHLEKQGTIVQHATESEDKTTAVVDTEARIKNLTGFRDNLRAMLAKPSATVKDSVDIQQQLTEVQSNLDSETAQRKILANETEKVAVVISFRIERTTEGGGGFKAIGDAFRESGSVLGESVASLITAVVAIIPWLIVIVPLLWLLRKMWRKYRKGRHVDRPPTASVV
jgi:Domain of unknown function (DUF4349)